MKDGKEGPFNSSQKEGTTLSEPIFRRDGQIETGNVEKKV